jgi:hypothetical protein
MCLGFYTACVSHVGRGQSALLPHARTKGLPHLAGTATQAHTWWFADTAELAELAEPAELASRTGRTEQKVQQRQTPT